MKRLLTTYKENQEGLLTDGEDLIKVFVSSIKWDGEDVSHIENSMKLTVPMNVIASAANEAEKVELIEEYVADEISNISGFCHDGFDMKVLSDEDN